MSRYVLSLALLSLLFIGCIKDISTGLNTGLQSESVGNYPDGSIHVTGDDAAVTDSFAVPYRSTIDLVQAPGGGAIVLRDVEPDLFLLTRLDASLDTLWTARIVRNAERKERMLSVVAGGEKVIIFSSFQPAWNSDSLHLVARAFALSGGMPESTRILAGVPGNLLGTGSRDFTLFISPNRSAIAACVIHPFDTANSRQIIDTRIVASDLTLLGGRRIILPKGREETKNRTPLAGTMAVDDRGNLHIVRFPKRTLIEAGRYAPNDAPDGVVTISIPGSDFRSGDSVSGEVEAQVRMGSDGRLHVEGGRMRYDQLHGMFAAMFDFNRGDRKLLFDSPITDDINRWMSEANGNREMELRRVVAPDTAGRYLFIFENAARVTDPMAIRFGIDISQLGTTASRAVDSTPLLYRYRDLYIFAFSEEGTPLWRSVVRKSYEEASFTNAHLDVALRAVPSREHLDLYYISRKNTGLARARVPLDGSPVPPFSLLVWLGRGAHLPLDRALFTDSTMTALTITRQGPGSAALRRIVLP